MKEFYDLLMASPLFGGVGREELASLLDCLGARPAGFARGDTVFLAGNPAERVGIVLEGSVQVVRDDVFGNRELVARLGAGQLFGETFACAGVETLPVSVLAAADCRVLLLDYRRIITSCPATCAFHARLIQNMLEILAEKNLLLNQKIEVLSARTTREKLMTYLGAQAAAAQRREFALPYSRQELADYLAVDRSALSREMSAMQREGLIRYDRNRFELLEGGAGDRTEARC